MKEKVCHHIGLCSSLLSVCQFICTYIHDVIHTYYSSSTQLGVVARSVTNDCNSVYSLSLSTLVADWRTKCKSHGKLFCKNMQCEMTQNEELIFQFPKLFLLFLQLQQIPFYRELLKQPKSCAITTRLLHFLRCI